MFQAYQRMWQHARDFNGKSGRYDYWTAVLATSFIVLVELQLVLFIDLLTNLSATTLLTIHAYLGFPILILHSLPLISLVVRRLNDAGQSTILALLLAVPGLGWVVLAFFLAKPSLYGNEKHSSKLEPFWQSYPKFSGCLSRIPFWKQMGTQFAFPLLILGYLNSLNRPEQMTYWMEAGLFLFGFIWYDYLLLMTPHWLGLICQRLRDAGYSTKFSFLFLIPIFGTIPLIFLLSKASQEEKVLN